MTNDRIVHIGVKRRSGRYPWGSGGDQISAGEVISIANDLEKKGLNQKEIAKAFGMKTTEYRNQKSLAKSEMIEDSRLNVIRQKERGMSVGAISKETGIAPSTIRDLLKPDTNRKFQIVRQIADHIRSMISKGQFVDVGDGIEVHLGVSRPRLDNAITLLKNEGYKKYYLDVEQLGTGKTTSMKILAGPDTKWLDVAKNKTKINIPHFFTEDEGVTFYKFTPDDINNISSSRVLVKYNTDGGGEKDGLIELRRGVPELNIGEKAYAQVRIGVDDTHFMKGMAVLRDDIPKGYDVVYNTSKNPSSDKLAAMKPQKEDSASKFGSVVRPNTFTKDGVDMTGMVNIIDDGKMPSVEGSWAKWKKNLSSQVLAKQSPKLATEQLEIAFKNRKLEFEEIDSLTNPVVRKSLLVEFGDKADKAALELKASALPRQTNSVLLPDPNMKPDEVYAPNYNNGDSVVLIRHPHGGVFEIPTLTVNNKYSEYRDIIGTAAPDAIAIHPDVAKKLSGADFDGDTVIVVPNKNKAIRTEPSLESLKNFDAKTAYPYYKGMKVMTESQKEQQMGDVSNLITDMTIKGASPHEIASAVRHSMVVIDAANHELNFTQSRIDNNIAALKKTYQGSARSGASTLISRAKSQQRIPQRVDHYTINPKTGEKVYSFTEETYINKAGDKVFKTTKSTKMASKKSGEPRTDPYEISSGTVIENVYAKHATKMMALGNQARLASLEQKAPRANTAAKITYKTEVDSLNLKLKAAIRARPVERKAQIVGNEIYKNKVESTPGMSIKEKQTQKGRALTLARVRLEAAKPVINITPREWEAIEMGAVSPTRLRSILRNSDMDVVRAYATPRAVKAGLSTGKMTRAKSLINSGYTAAEVAGALGVPVSQIREIDKS